MRFNDAIIGIVLIVFALAEIAYTTTFPRLHGQDYGPDLFPALLGVGLIVCGVILIFKGYAKRTSEPLMVVGDWVENPRNISNVFLLLGSIVFYILASQWLGFILTALVILVTLLVRLGSSWRLSFIVAIATTFIIHTLFAKVLLVPLPWGILLPLAW